MSARVTHFHHISTSASDKNTFEDIVKSANAFVKNLQETCNKRNYACLAIVCISEHDLKLGEIKAETRDHKVFVPLKPEYNKKIDPHIHIIILANPCETLSQYTIKYFQKKNIKSQHVCCDDYIQNAVPYAIKQSTKIRVAYCNIDALPKDMLKEFYTLAEEVNKSMNASAPIFKKISADYFQNEPVSETENDADPFTKIDTKEHDNYIINIRNENADEISSQLQCNNKYTGCSSITSIEQVPCQVLDNSKPPHSISYILPILNTS